MLSSDMTVFSPVCLDFQLVAIVLGLATSALLLCGKKKAPKKPTSTNSPASMQKSSPGAPNSMEKAPPAPATAAATAATTATAPTGVSSGSNGPKGKAPEAKAKKDKAKKVEKVVRTETNEDTKEGSKKSTKMETKPVESEKKKPIVYPSVKEPTKTAQRRTKEQLAQEKKQKIAEGFYQQKSDEDETLEQVKSLVEEASEPQDDNSKMKAAPK